MTSPSHVLVVEDDHPIRKLLQRQLASLGCRVDLAVDGNEGLALWECNDYDLVITDFSMPGMNGLELAARIRASGRRTAQSVPVIAITGHTGHEHSGGAAGAVTDILGKPFSKLDLQRVLERWLPAPHGADVRNPSRDDAGTVPAHAAAPGLADDPAIMRSVVRTFVETIPDYLHSLHRACEAGNPAAIVDAAHKLKSAARLVGGDAVADLCEAIEAAPGDTEISGLLLLAAPLPDAVKELERSLKQLLASADVLP